VKVSIVAAVARNGVIGRDGAIPWRIPEDLARFRELTMGHAVVMGRKTWDSLPDRFRPLPGRRNVVVTRNAQWSADGAERAGSLEEALRQLEGGPPRVFVIGGGDLYRDALPVADELVLTEIDADFDGDTLFPLWDRDAFEEVSRDEHVSADGLAFAFVTYRRRADPVPELGSRQLSALADVDVLFEQAGIAYWLFGGWAVDFYAGSVTRPHDDVDVAVWLDDLPRIAALLEAKDWRHTPSSDDDGGTGFEREGVRIELTYLARGDDGHVVTPLRDRDALWPDGTFSNDTRELHGVRARLIRLESLAGGKSSPRDDPAEAAKDRADFDVLSGL
jgi:dihydrofolate reductase